MKTDVQQSGETETGEGRHEHFKNEDRRRARHEYFKMKMGGNEDIIENEIDKEGDKQRSNKL